MTNVSSPPPCSPPSPGSVPRRVLAGRRRGSAPVPAATPALASLIRIAWVPPLLALLAGGMGCDRSDPPAAPSQASSATGTTGSPTSSDTNPTAPSSADAGAPPALAPDTVPAGTDPSDPLLAVLGDLPSIATIEPGPPEALPSSLAPFFRLIGEGRPDVARVRIRKHLALEPDDGLAHFLFGLTYHRERRYTEAIPWFADAIRLAPTYAPSFYFAAWGRFYLGELELAERLWRRHLAHEPEAADTHFGLGLVDLEHGRAEAAAERFRRAIAIEENEPGRERSVAKAWARLGDALADLDRPEEARAALERAVTMWPDHHEAWARLGRLLRRLGDTAAAEEAEAEAAEALDRTRGSGEQRP